MYKGTEVPWEVYETRLSTVSPALERQVKAVVIILLVLPPLLLFLLPN
jgi:hypothetical protein